MSSVTKQLHKSYNGIGFAAEYSSYADRTGKDVNGNSLELTIENDSVTEVGGRRIVRPMTPANVTWQVLNDEIQPPSTVQIAGRSYKTCKIGSLEWMAENLKWDGPSESNMYVSTDIDDRDERYYRLGYIRQMSSGTFTLSEEFQSIIPNGWRFPTNADVNSLLEEIGSNPLAILPTPDGDDRYGFNASSCQYMECYASDDYPGVKGMPIGLRYVLTSEPYDLESYGIGLLEIRPDSGTLVFWRNEDATGIEEYFSLPIRLVRDA